MQVLVKVWARVFTCAHLLDLFFCFIWDVSTPPLVDTRACLQRVLLYSTQQARCKLKALGTQVLLRLCRV